MNRRKWVDMCEARMGINASWLRLVWDHEERISEAVHSANLQRIPITHLEEVKHHTPIDGTIIKQTKVMNGSHVYADIVTKWRIVT